MRTAPGGDFPLNTAMTTTYGPAWADVALAPTDFLPCFGPYALCYYANCTVSADGKVSDCPCYEWFGPNFVLINGILNLDTWQATVAQCTADPASCQKTNGAPVRSSAASALLNSSLRGEISCVVIRSPLTM